MNVIIIWGKTTKIIENPQITIIRQTSETDP